MIDSNMIKQTSCAGTGIDETQELNQLQSLRNGARRWLSKKHPDHLLNLFTVLQAVAALIIMLVVGGLMYLTYGMVVVKNAESAALSVTNLIATSEMNDLSTVNYQNGIMMPLTGETLKKFDAGMHRYLKPFGMHKIKIFAMDKTIVYSTVASLIGTKEESNKLLAHVIRRQESISTLEQKKSFAELGGKQLSNVTVVEAYSPVMNSANEFIGVIEVYVDVTKEKLEVGELFVLAMTAIGVVLSICLYILYLPMKRGTRRLIAARDELRELATKDYLTGAYNRRYINDRVKEEFHRRRRHGGVVTIENSIAFIMADIDYFKRVNDVHGHGAGDQVLQEVSTRLKAGLRDYDVLCRYGGEEFMIMLPHTSEDEAMVIAERLRQSVMKRSILTQEGQEISVTVSFGVATSMNEADAEMTVILRADQALYTAKETGRNKVVLAKAVGITSEQEMPDEK